MRYARAEEVVSGHQFCQICKHLKMSRGLAVRVGLFFTQLPYFGFNAGAGVVVAAPALEWPHKLPVRLNFFLISRNNRLFWTLLRAKTCSRKSCRWLNVKLAALFADLDYIETQMILKIYFSGI